MKNPSTSTTFIVKLLQSLAKVAALTAAVAVSATFNSGPALAANPLTGQESAVISRTNQIRAEAGLPALTANQSLNISATNKAKDMATRGYFDHATPEGQRMSYWINSTGYVYSLAGENLAKGYSSLDRLMNAWVASPTHYKNLVEPKFTQIGIGMAEGWYEDQPTLFVVQHFAAEVTPVVKELNQLTSGMATLISPLVEGVTGSATEGQAGTSQSAATEPAVTILSDTTVAETGSESPISMPQKLALARIAQASALEPTLPANGADADQAPINWLVVAIVIAAAVIVHIGIDEAFWLNLKGHQSSTDKTNAL